MLGITANHPLTTRNCQNVAISGPGNCAGEIATGDVPEASRASILLTPESDARHSSIVSAGNPDRLDFALIGVDHGMGELEVDEGWVILGRCTRDIGAGEGYGGLGLRSSGGGIGCWSSKTTEARPGGSRSYSGWGPKEPPKTLRSVIASRGTLGRTAEHDCSLEETLRHVEPIINRAQGRGGMTIRFAPRTFWGKEKDLEKGA